MKFKFDPENMNVDIVSDVACGWSYLGYTRFARAAARHRANGARVTVTFRPFQLTPEATAEPEPLLAVLRRKFGGDPERTTAEFAAYAARDGLEFNYGRAIHSNTFEAHRLIAVAARQGRPEEMVERLFRAHYTDGLDVADRDTLRRLADEVGVVWDDSCADEVRAELDQVRFSGVTQIPVFRFPDGITLSGAQPENSYFAAIEQSLHPTDTCPKA